MPPERNAPSGTSAIMRRRTASRSSASSALHGLFRAARLGCRARRDVGDAPVRAIDAARLPAQAVRIDPGGSLLTPRNIVAGAGT